MRIGLIYMAAVLLGVSLSSCFTGVESTGKITLPEETKTEKQSPEDAFIESYFVPQGCDSWRVGKRATNLPRQCLFEGKDFYLYG